MLVATSEAARAVSIIKAAYPGLAGGKAAAASSKLASAAMSPLVLSVIWASFRRVLPSVAVRSGRSVSSGGRAVSNPTSALMA